MGCGSSNNTHALPRLVELDKEENEKEEVLSIKTTEEVPAEEVIAEGRADETGNDIDIRKERVAEAKMFAAKVVPNMGDIVSRWKSIIDLGVSVDIDAGKSTDLASADISSVEPAKPPPPQPRMPSRLDQRRVEVKSARAKLARVQSELDQLGALVCGSTAKQRTDTTVGFSNAGLCGDVGAAFILAGFQACSMIRLNLSGNPLKDAGVRALCVDWPQLMTIDLSRTQVTLMALDAFLGWCPCLEELSLAENPLGSSCALTRHALSSVNAQACGVTAMRFSSWLRSTCRLCLKDNPLMRWPLRFVCDLRGCPLFESHGTLTYMLATGTSAIRSSRRVEAAVLVFACTCGLAEVDLNVLSKLLKQFSAFIPAKAGLTAVRVGLRPRCFSWPCAEHFMTFERPKFGT